LNEFAVEPPAPTDGGPGFADVEATTGLARGLSLLALAGLKTAVLEISATPTTAAKNRTLAKVRRVEVNR
jgi:hypothetical protein